MMIQRANLRKQWFELEFVLDNPFKIYLTSCYEKFSAGEIATYTIYSYCVNLKKDVLFQMNKNVAVDTYK